MEFSNAFREGTNQPPWLITAGNWKHKLFPKDVDACRKTSWPSTAAVITSRCRGLSNVGSLADDDNTFEVPYSPERLFTKDAAQVKVQIDLVALETGAYHRYFRSFSGHEEAWEVEDGFTSVKTARRKEETRYHVGSYSLRQITNSKKNT